MKTLDELDALWTEAEAAGREASEPGARYGAVARATATEEAFVAAMHAAWPEVRERLRRAERIEVAACTHLDALCDFDDVRDWTTTQPEYVQREDALDAARAALRAALTEEPGQ